MKGDLTIENMQKETEDSFQNIANKRLRSLYKSFKASEMQIQELYQETKRQLLWDMQRHGVMMPDEKTQKKYESL